MSKESFTIHIGRFAFDPLKTTKKLNDEFARAKLEPSKSHYLVVQFNKSLDRAERDALQRKHGLKLSDYIPNRAFIEKLTKKQLKRLASEDLFRASVPYVSAFKVSPSIGKVKHRTPERREMEGFWIEIIFFPETVLSKARNWLKGKGIRELQVLDDRKSGGQLRLRCTVADRDTIEGLADLEEVRWIEEVAEIIEDNTTAATTIQSGTAGVGSVWDRGLHGEAQIIGVLDSAPLDINHCFFRDAVNNTPGPAHRKVVALRNLSATPAGGHGTFVSGCAAGDDLNLPGANIRRGGAWAARLVSGNRRDFAFNSLLTELNAAATAGATIHTNSWHDNTAGAGNPATYNQNAADVDTFTWNNEDHLVLGSAGNNGEEQGPPGTAKNAICVSAAQSDPNEMNFGDGNPGPTADGRLKPDLMTVGCQIQSATVNTACGTGPRSACATSYATPHAAAAAALIRQYYTEGWYPTGTPQNADAFIPSGALVKATLINTTIDMTGIPGYPSANEGWGLVRLEDALHFAGNSRTLCVWDVRNADGLYTGEAAEHRVDVVNGTQQLKVTLAWTEPPGTAGAANPVINNLDLEVISPSGTHTFLGNRFASGASVTGGTPDTINNVEMVLINDPAPGYWTVRVVGADVNVGNPGQGYALVATGELAKQKEEDAMGMAKLNIFVSELDDPCGISDRTWYITIYDCDGKVLEWCGERYAVMRAPCGHLEVKVPPGCYYIKGVWSYWRVPGGYRANHFTDAAIVQACCEQTTCVKLFNPSVHRCGLILLMALEDLILQKVIKRAQFKSVAGPLRRLLKAIGKVPRRKFELGHTGDFDRLTEEKDND